MNNDFIWQTEQFADTRILRYRIEGFENLSLNQKIFAWYLYQAAMTGRDINMDQNYKYNILIRRCLETIIHHYRGSRNSESWNNFYGLCEEILVFEWHAPPQFDGQTEAGIH